MTRLSNLLGRLPTQAVVGTAWLKQHDVSRELAKHYVRSGALARVGSGAFARAGGSTPSWEGAVWGLQQVGEPVWPGGATALGMTGYGQNVAFTDQARVTLFADASFHLPAWFRRQKWASRVALHRKSLFTERPDESAWQFATWNSEQLKVSAPELAVLELAATVTDDHSFEQLELAMQSLPTLRPARMNGLLSACKSVKVNRLVMLLGEHFQHPWVQRVDSAQINLGSGKRQLWAGGAMHPKYHITVSQSLLNAQA